MTVLLEYVIVVQGAVGPAGVDGAGMEAAGVGAGVTPDGQAVMMAGLFGT